MRHLPLLFATLGLLVSAASCNSVKQTRPPRPLHHTTSTNAIYHWKGIFNPTDEELDFMANHDIGRLYIRMFDIATEYDANSDSMVAVPIATTRFEQAPPRSVEVVPVTYITVDALRKIEGEESSYAHLIVERMKAMVSYNDCGIIKEIQYDCDWTASTRHIFFALCRHTCDILHDEGVDLSVTVRLHQMTQEAPMADRGVLMLYNTGALRNPNTRNSILDVADVEPYLRKCNYPLPLDYAYPTYGWSLLFRDNRFVRIVSDGDSVELADNETLRVERATASEVLDVKHRAERAFGRPYQSNIIYHLDINQLNNYTEDEINQILAGN